MQRGTCELHWSGDDPDVPYRASGHRRDRPASRMHCDRVQGGEMTVRATRWNHEPFLLVAREVPR
jgi:hypothetical protein